jgi:hypothetical protein
MISTVIYLHPLTHTWVYTLTHLPEQLQHAYRAVGLTAYILPVFLQEQAL